MTDVAGESVREAVRSKYANRALQVSDGESCCGSASGCSPITSNLYTGDEIGLLPEDAVKASLGCGNPTALASLSAGEVVLDLGSGGGIDVLLSAKRVGPTGFAYGLDMTDEMLALAEKNRAEQGAENVKFLKGHIEDLRHQPVSRQGPRAAGRLPRAQARWPLRGLGRGGSR